MFFCLITVLVVLHCLDFSLLNIAAPVSNAANHFCVNSVPNFSFSEVVSGLVCGTSLTSDMAYDLRALGLIHLFVVSGGHLSFIEGMWKTFRLPPRSLIYFLIFFTFLTGLQPPCVRALVHIGVSRLSNRSGWNLRNHQIPVIAGIITLLLSPHWIQSFSFLLSWFAAIALSVLSPRSQYNLNAHVVVYLILAPVLSHFGTQSPLTIVCNYFFIPLIGAVLFPLSIGTILQIVPVTLTEKFFDVFFQLCKTLAPEVPVYSSSPSQIVTYWIVLILIHLFVQKGYTYVLRPHF